MSGLIFHVKVWLLTNNYILLFANVSRLLLSIIVISSQYIIPCIKALCS